MPVFLFSFVRTLYYNVFDEKINTKYLVKYLERMLYSTTFAPAFERERRTNMMKGVTCGKGMRLEILSKIPTAAATQKNFEFFF